MSEHTRTRTNPASPSSFIPVSSNLLQRKCACGGMPGIDGVCTECRGKRLTGSQHFPLNQADTVAAPPIVSDILRSPGQPLDSGTRTDMETRFGHSFEKVRVHTDARAVQSARAVNALAYTVGRDIVFGTGQYEPGTTQGRKLLGHELTHVVQQEQHSRTTASPQANLDVNQPGDTAEVEADMIASRDLVSSNDLRSRDFVHPLASLQRQEAVPGVTPVNPEISNLPWEERYVDAFEDVQYDLDYKGEPRGSLSEWLQVRYSDGEVVDIHFDQIIDESVSPEEAENLKRQGSLGAGGRIFPQRMNPSTTPRLWAVKQEALKVMDDYNALFILGTFSTVWLIITMGLGAGGTPPRAVRTPMSRRVSPPAAGQGGRQSQQPLPTRPPAREAEQPPAPTAPSPTSTPRRSATVPETGARGSQAASVRQQTRVSEGGERGPRAPSPGPWRGNPTIQNGNLNEGWTHIEARHVTGTHPHGAGDLFAAGTTRTQLQRAATDVVRTGTRISDPSRRIQVFERRMTINGQSDNVRVVVDTRDGRVITIFPVRGGG